MFRSFVLASETHELARPVHLLGALSEIDGPIGAVLQPPSGAPLLARPADPPPSTGGGASYLSMQTREAASDLASKRGEITAPGHLLLAVIDQAEPEAIGLLTNAGIDLGAVRGTALDMLGAPRGLPAIPIPPLTPAGTLDRPALSEHELDPHAWEILTRRQARLPLDALRTPKDWYCLQSVEASAARRVAKRRGVNRDVELSLYIRHLEHVRRIAHQARPRLVPASRWDEPSLGLPQGRTVTGWIDDLRRPRMLDFTVGWGCWCSNRVGGINQKWLWLETRRFSLRTRSAYGGTSSPV